MGLKLWENASFVSSSYYSSLINSNKFMNDQFMSNVCIVNIKYLYLQLILFKKNDKCS